MTATSRNAETASHRPDDCTASDGEGETPKGCSRGGIRPTSVTRIGEKTTEMRHPHCRSRRIGGAVGQIVGAETMWRLCEMPARESGIRPASLQCCRNRRRPISDDVANARPAPSAFVQCHFGVVLPTATRCRQHRRLDHVAGRADRDPDRGGGN